MAKGYKDVPFSSYVRWFAPGVLKLGGEHAVVYGRPAIAFAIDKGVRISARRRDDGKLVVNVEGVRVRVNVVSLEEGRVNALVDEGELLYALRYVRKAVEVVEREFGRIRGGLELSISSDLPMNVGMGTSAAVSSATIAAALSSMGVDVGKDEVARMAHAVELEVQGIASPMDTYVSTHGGIHLVKTLPKFTAVRLEVNMPKLLVVAMERRGSTEDLVKAVRRLKEEFPEVVNGVFNAIGSTVELMVEALMRGDRERLGRLMRINNELLNALGVGDERVTSLLARISPMVYGGKISGAGGGGAILLIPREGLERALEETIRSMGYEVMEVGLDVAGLRRVDS